MVDATFSHVGPMSGSELRELASQIPMPMGNKSLAPPILATLPKGSLDGQSTHYAVGPASYSGSGGVLPADLVGFDRGAETVTASYSLRSNPAVLTLIDYPTPQLAAAQESENPRLYQGGKAGESALLQAAHRLRPGLAGSSPKRTHRRPGKRRRHPRREPQAARELSTTKRTLCPSRSPANRKYPRLAAC